MKAFNSGLVGMAVLSVVFMSGAVRAAPPDEADTWSKPARCLQARVTLMEKPKINGTRSIVPSHGICLLLPGEPGGSPNSRIEATTASTAASLCRGLFA